MTLYLIYFFKNHFNCSLFLSSICFNCFKSPSSFSSSFNPLLKALPSDEYSNVDYLTTPSLYPKSSPIKYLYLSDSLDDNEKF